MNKMAAKTRGYSSKTGGGEQRSDTLHSKAVRARAHAGEKIKMAANANI
jgi:hypothetical protein